MLDWQVAILGPLGEFAISLSHAISFFVGLKKIPGFDLAVVTAILGAAAIIGHRNVTISQNVKAASSRAPIWYAVTSLLGAIGSAIIPAQLAPRLFGCDLAKVGKDHEEFTGVGHKTDRAGVFAWYRDIEPHAHRISADSAIVGRPARELHHADAWRSDARHGRQHTFDDHGDRRFAFATA